MDATTEVTDARRKHHPDAPSRVEIDRRNRRKWRGMSPEGMARVRAATL